MTMDFHRWLIADYEAGTLTWKPRSRNDFPEPNSWVVNWNLRNAGKEVRGSKHRQGYLRFPLLGKHYYRHRVIFCMAHGFMPPYVDHINGNTGCDRLTNLREVTYRENYLNQKMTKATGHLGVYPTPQGNWRAMIRLEGKLLHLGTFPVEADAVAARQRASEAHGFHPNHGRKVLK